MQAPALTIGAPTVNLTYWERHQLEYHWDTIAVEYSVNGGVWNDVPPPSNSPASGCALSDSTTDWEAITCTQAPPINACGYPTAKQGWVGPFGSGTTCTDWVSGATTGYAHRCHAIDALIPGDTIQFRWRFASDPGSEFAGFYLDDVAVSPVVLPNVCTPCGPPAEIAGVAVNGHSGTTVSWTPLGGSVVYDVASSTLSDLFLNGTAGATCLADDVAGAGTPDGRPDPAPGDGYYYLVRGQTACGTGSYGTSSAGPERLPAAGCP
jgi:hypothetical protein